MGARPLYARRAVEGQGRRAGRGTCVRTRPLLSAEPRDWPQRAGGAAHINEGTAERRGGDVAIDEAAGPGNIQNPGLRYVDTCTDAAELEVGWRAGEERYRMHAPTERGKQEGSRARERAIRRQERGPDHPDRARSRGLQRQPRSRGGAGARSALVTACPECSGAGGVRVSER